MDDPAGGRWITASCTSNHLQVNHRGRGHEYGAHAVFNSSPPLLPVSVIMGDDMSMFKQGDTWRWNDRSDTHLYRIHLREICKQQHIKASAVAAFIGQSTSQMSRYMRGLDMPPSSTQDMIAIYVGRKHRAEIWEFRRDLFPELKKIHDLTNELCILQSHMKQKIEHEYNGGSAA
jgi:transcriptional regulator with XRE-family HTH domain